MKHWDKVFKDLPHHLKKENREIKLKKEDTGEKKDRTIQPPLYKLAKGLEDVLSTLKNFPANKEVLQQLAVSLKEAAHTLATNTDVQPGQKKGPAYPGEAAECEALACEIDSAITQDAHHIFSMMAILDQSTDGIKMQTAALYCRAYSERFGKAGKKELARQYSEIAQELEELASDGFWPEGMAMREHRWPVIPPWQSNLEGSLWANMSDGWKEDMYGLMRKDTSFLNKYKMPAVKLQEDVKQVAAKEVVEEVKVVIDDDRAKTVGMALVQLMMKYRDVMKAPGKSKEERERDFMVLMRNKLLAMEPDIVGVEKHLDLMQTFFPRKGKVKKKDEVIEYQELADLEAAWPHFNVNMTEGKLPCLCDRMLLVMSTVPGFLLRLKCCHSMLTLAKNLDERVKRACAQMDAYSTAMLAVVKCYSLTNILRGICTTANFVNHTIKLARMNLMERGKCKETQGFDLNDAFENLTSYCASTTWQDNDRENTILQYVLKFLHKLSGEAGMDAEDMRKVAELMNTALKAKIWNLESQTDEIEAHINMLRRAIGELNDYSCFEVINGVETRVCEDDDKRVPKASVKSAPDEFHATVQKCVSSAQKYVPMMREAREKMYKAGVMLMVHCDKKDTSKHFGKGVLALPEKALKMPMPEKQLRLLQRILNEAIVVFESTNPAGVMSKGASIL